MRPARRFLDYLCTSHCLSRSNLGAIHESLEFCWRRVPSAPVGRPGCRPSSRRTIRDAQSASGRQLRLDSGSWALEAWRWIQPSNASTVPTPRREIYPSCLIDPRLRNPEMLRRAGPPAPGLRRAGPPKSWRAGRKKCRLELVPLVCFE